MGEPIPGPPGLPFLGNVNDIDPSNATASLCRIADIYGPIFKLTVGGVDKIYVSDQELVNEVCDEKRFTKMVHAGLNEVRNGLHDGLFTARPGEHNWEIAHRTLVPAFGPLPIQSMYDEMYDLSTQLVAKWARFGPNEKISVADDFTRLTLDSIALCAMGTRFNSFYHDDLHPFVHAMVDFLIESGKRSQRPRITQYFMKATNEKYEADIALLQKTARDLAADRRANPTDKKDLLNAMIYGRDPKTGEGLTDDSICNNMITFLIAGHETTAGLLSFCFYNLLKNPAAYQKLQKEIDEVLGRDPVTYQHVSNKLPYVEACLKETLRLSPPAPSFTVGMRPDAPEDHTFIGGGKYLIKKGQTISLLLARAQRDPKVFGDDSEDFKPERMLPDVFATYPPNSFKAFGNGARGCIGRPFAWQEATLALAMLIQNFDFRMDDPSYQLQIKSTLTVKPKGFYMYATLRNHIDATDLEKLLFVGKAAEAKSVEKDRAVQKVAASGKPKKPMTILYGSNAGTCEALAQNLARTASGRAYNAKVSPLDTAVDKIPNDQPVVVITASYEGQPPDNAAHFVEWLEKLEGSDKLKGINYAVFGCGNHDWASTFYRIPKLIDVKLGENGATQITKAGLGDVAEGDIFGDFDKWQDEGLWKALGVEEDSEGEIGLDIEIESDNRRTRLRQDVQEAVVISNTVLTAKGEPEKRHVELKLPTGMEYKVGDYLAVLPLNNTKMIRRVLKWAKLPWDTNLTIKAGNTTLPTGRPISAMDILGAYVELSQPATRKNIAKIAASSADDAERTKILELANNDFEKEIMFKRRSVLDVLEEFPSAALPFGDFLAMLPPMRVRQYSISSTPLADPTVATITWSVVDAPAKSTDSKRFLGVASNYLSFVEEGEKVHVAVKPSHGSFHPPKDIENTPVIMMCAGTGLAPFRGFVQERALQIKAGRKLAPAYLFIGCTHPEKDVLFDSELKQWEKEGVVKVYYAYSKSRDDSKGARHVQDRVWEEREEMKKVFDEGAKLYVCGSSHVGEGVAEMIKRIYEDAAEAKGVSKTEEEVQSWWDGVKSDRYASDVFA